MPMFEITIVPIGTNSPSLSKYVKISYEEIKKSGLKFQLTPMGTCIIGDFKEVFKLVEKIHNKLAALGIERISTQIKIDDRRDKEITFDSKIKAVIK
ncbi:MAG: MTH1187 family thiamine-binding protein [Deltaproteobacteria bacterium]|nr:MTH1187 family thiamine-binding protein [Deltaproteobacteria bacterium]